jgi:methionyl-tRNA formyltransferase
MRILCCLNRDLVSSVALNLLLAHLGEHEVTVALSDRIGGARNDADEPAPRRELRVAEQTVAIECLFPLIDRTGFADDGHRYLTFEEVERHRGISVISLPNPNTADALATIGALGPDLILSIRYGAIFKPAVLSLPRLGTLNLHAGLLPAYRGVIASFRALMHGETELGCTLHYISDAGIDRGDIVATCRLPVRPDRSLFWHVMSLYPGAIELVVAALRDVSRGGPLRRTPQNHSLGAYYSYPTAAEWSEFMKRGWRVVDVGDLAEILQRFMAPHSIRPAP